MWINPLFDISQREAAFDIVRANPLAILVAAGTEIHISHMPLLLEIKEDGDLELVGHIPLVDPVAEAIQAGNNITAIFQGPQSYISPSWYVDPGLPTYNFLVAHLTGIPRVMQTDEELREHLIELIASHEAQCPVTGTKWQPDAVADARIDQLLPRIMGFRIEIDQLQAKAKLGQNRSVADQQKAAEALRTSPRSDDHRIAKLMELSSEQRIQEQETQR